MGQTVNLLVFTFGGSNPSPPTPLKRGRSYSSSAFFSKNPDANTCGSSSVGRALAFQAGGRGFEPRLPLHQKHNSSKNAVLAQW